MELIHGLSEWLTSFANSPYGAAMLSVIAFAESSFFPLPPDILQIPLSLNNPSLALVFASIATVSSVLGGCFGYFLGDKGGRRILEKIVSKEKILTVEHYYQKYDVWAVGIAAFTPIPYKVFTLSAGVFKLNFKRFVLVSIVGRGGRFFLVGLLVYFFGPSVKLFLDQYFEVVIVGFTVLLIGGFVGMNYFSKIMAKRSEKGHHHDSLKLKNKNS